MGAPNNENIREMRVEMIRNFLGKESRSPLVIGLPLAALSLENRRRREAVPRGGGCRFSHGRCNIHTLESLRCLVMFLFS